MTPFSQDLEDALRAALVPDPDSETARAVRLPGDPVPAPSEARPDPRVRRLQTLLGRTGEAPPLGFHLTERTLRMPTTAAALDLHGRYELELFGDDERILACVLAEPSGRCWVLFEIDSHTAPSRCELRAAPPWVTAPQDWLFGIDDAQALARLRVGAQVSLPAVPSAPTDRVPVDALPPTALRAGRRALLSALAALDAAGWAVEARYARASAELVFEGQNARAWLSEFLEVETEEAATDRALAEWEETREGGWVRDAEPVEEPRYVGQCLRVDFGELTVEALLRDGADRFEVWVSSRNGRPFPVDPSLGESEGVSA